MPDQGPPARKSRDSLADQISAPVYTGDPVPPYISILKDLTYISYRADPATAAALLPPGLTPVAGTTITLAIMRAGEGFGLANLGIGFFAIAINEHPAPDTSEAAVCVDAVMSASHAHLAHQHYGPFLPGDTEIVLDAEGLIHARMWAADGSEIVRATLRPTGPLQPQAANDRYLGHTAGGQLVAAYTSVTGPSRPCEVLSLTIGATASPAVRSLTPQTILFGVHSPELLFCWSAPEPIERLPWDSAGRAGQAALLDILDRQARACAILSPTGTVLHGNAAALQMLDRLPSVRRNPLRLAGAADQARFLTALATCAEQRPDRPDSRFLLATGADRAPLILHLLPSNPLLAGPGTVLALISDPMDQGMQRDPGLLQLLGLTPGEARIAAAVGAGLPPREAALSLGLAESTVRSSLKVIFDKLGVRRQADLVRIVMRLTL